MGFPIGWTELNPPATPLSRKSRKSSGAWAIMNLLSGDQHV